MAAQLHSKNLIPPLVLTSELMATELERDRERERERGGGWQRKGRRGLGDQQATFMQGERGGTQEGQDRWKEIPAWLNTGMTADYRALTDEPADGLLHILQPQNPAIPGK